MPSSFVLSAAIAYSLLCVRDGCACKHLRASGSAALPQGPSLRSGFFCPDPSTLNRPHPPHSRAHLDFTVSRLIPDALAVPIRIGLGDPRLVPCFRCGSFSTCRPHRPRGVHRPFMLSSSPTMLAFAVSSPARHSHQSHHPLPMGRCFRGYTTVRFRYGLPICSPPWRI